MQGKTRMTKPREQRRKLPTRERRKDRHEARGGAATRPITGRDAHRGAKQLHKGKKLRRERHNPHETNATQSANPGAQRKNRADQATTPIDRHLGMTVRDEPICASGDGQRRMNHEKGALAKSGARWTAGQPWRAGTPREVRTELAV